MKIKALIIGITGQDGSYLAKKLLENKISVDGTSTFKSQDPLWRLQYLNIEKNLNVTQLDLQNKHKIEEIIKTGEYTYIFNLASESFVPDANSEIKNTIDTNGYSTYYILEAIRKYSGNSRYFHASSSEIYARASVSPQREITPRKPNNIYGIAKLIATELCEMYREKFQLFIVVGVLYNHESCLRSDKFISKKIINGINDIINGKQKYLELGNLNSKRDWGYAPEYIIGIMKAINHDTPRTYNIGTGKLNSVRTLLTMVFQKFEIDVSYHGNGLDEVVYDKNGKLVAKVNKKFYRDSEQTMLVSNTSYLYEQLKWKPEILLNQTIDLIIDELRI